MKIKFPTRYEIEYPEKNINYYDNYGQKKIKPILTNASNGYCMYCGNRILINNRNLSQIEHSVEKVQKGVTINYLKHCKFNMAIACAPCNVKFKKYNISSIDVLNDYECENRCDAMCEEYKKNYIEHCKKNKIILMPQGVKCKEKDIYYEIHYDLLKLLFLPCDNPKYSVEDKEYIQTHIDRFNLNSPKYMPKEIIDVCESFIQSKIIPNKGSYNNVIADIFIEYLEKIKLVSVKNTLKICELILILSSL